MDKAVIDALIEEHGGYWEEHSGYTVGEWMREVSEGNTRLGYWEWVAVSIERDTEEENNA
jgi:hypothetical protein